MQWLRTGVKNGGITGYRRGRSNGAASASPVCNRASRSASQRDPLHRGDLARWHYRQLEAEYDQLASDEAIEERIIVNEYTFTEAGRRFG